MPANAKVPLLIQAQDPDFELGYLYLNIEKSGQKIVRDQISEGRQPKLTINQDLTWERSARRLVIVLELWIETYDNRAPRPNTRNTAN